MIASRMLRRALSGRVGSSTPFLTLERNAANAHAAVKTFYLISVLYAASNMGMLHDNAGMAAGLDLTWPVLWLRGRNLLMWADIISTLAVATALWAYLDPRSFAARAGFATSLLLCGGFTSSFGGINHAFHSWFWIALVLVFLPAGQARANKLSYCLTFATAQGLLLGFYSLAGLAKLIDGFAALIYGYEGNFSPRGLALTFADRMTQTGTTPLLGHWFVDHWWLSLPTFAAVIYVQLVAVSIAYRPRLQAAWGIALIVFHVGTFLFMEIIFTVNMLLVLVFLVASPFQPSGWLQWSTLAELPIFGPLFRLRPHPQVGGVVAAQ